MSPPLYSFLLSGWMRLFGDSEIALRLPSVLFYLAGICLMWFLGRMLLGVEG
ncbi:glycosyltransferase family 39 protein, partial [Salmonella sp. SAL4437]|uniref:glycosyltransferase family 39 protein n=1 Tax=Salmonella sp. SAL4437 TaxID=3159892 RepID=UPI003979F866